MDFAPKNQQGSWNLKIVPETGSTNTDLLQAGLSGAPDRTVLRADHQTAGRGRLDRTWEAPAGRNLLVSFLFRSVPDDPHVLAQAVSIAARDAARSVGVDAVLKWPNDLLVGTRKLGGMLAQAGPLVDGRPSFVVVGIGVNIAAAPEGAASLANSGWSREVSPQEFLDLMLPRIDGLLALGTEGMHATYRESLATIGARVSVEVPSGETIVGRALDVTPDGLLVVLDDCAVTHRFDTADVVHLRPAGS